MPPAVPGLKLLLLAFLTVQASSQGPASHRLRKRVDPNEPKIDVPWEHHRAFTSNEQPTITEKNLHPTPLQPLALRRMNSESRSSGRPQPRLARTASDPTQLGNSRPRWEQRHAADKQHRAKQRAAEERAAERRALFGKIDTEPGMARIIGEREVGPARQRAKNNLQKAEMYLDNFQKDMGKLISERIETYTSNGCPSTWEERPEWFGAYQPGIRKLGQRAADAKAKYLAAQKELEKDVLLLRGVQGSRLAKPGDQLLAKKVAHLDRVYQLREEGPYTAALKRHRRDSRIETMGPSSLTDEPTVPESRKRGFCGVDSFLRADQEHENNFQRTKMCERMRFHEGRDIRRKRARMADPRVGPMLEVGHDPHPPLHNPYFWHTDDRQTYGMLPKDKLPLIRPPGEDPAEHVPLNDYPRG